MRINQGNQKNAESRKLDATSWRLWAHLLLQCNVMCLPELKFYHAEIAKCDNLILHIKADLAFLCGQQFKSSIKILKMIDCKDQTTCNPVIKLLTELNLN